MAVTEEARNHMFNVIRDRLGPEVAATMMEMLPPVGWADVARRNDLDQLERAFERRFDAVDSRFDRLEHRMDAFEVALRDQTRFYVTCVFAAMAANIAVVGTIVGLATR